MNESFERVPLILRTGSEPAVRETYGFTAHGIVLEGQLLRPRGASTEGTVFVFLHPTGSLNVLPMPTALAARGHHVLCAASRYPRNDTALIMEKVVLDLGSWVAWARGAGYEKVVLVGWSGGGSLSLLYQAEALAPSITHTPAGDPVDLTAAGLQPADAVVFIAAHLSRAETLTEWLDPSVLDELDPARRDPRFDIYAQDARVRPPYDADFVAEFRAAQRARNRRISDWALHRLAELRADPGPEQEQAFLVHRTMCDVRWLDPAVDPNGRAPGSCYLGDPRVANVGPVGLARYTTLRSWLSQWTPQPSWPPAGRRTTATNPRTGPNSRATWPSPGSTPSSAQHRSRSPPRSSTPTPRSPRRTSTSPVAPTRSAPSSTTASAALLPPSLRSSPTRAARRTCASSAAASTPRQWCSSANPATGSASPPTSRARRSASPAAAARSSSSANSPSNRAD